VAKIAKPVLKIKSHALLLRKTVRPKYYTDTCEYGQAIEVNSVAKIAKPEPMD
jgi:hypothetical protein